MSWEKKSKIYLVEQYKVQIYLVKKYKCIERTNVMVKKSQNICRKTFLSVWPFGHLLTRDGVAKLLPVTPDVSRPHCREASNPREGGARQDEGSLLSYLHESTEDAEMNAVCNENYKRPKNHSAHIFSVQYAQLNISIVCTLATMQNKYTFQWGTPRTSTISSSGFSVNWPKPIWLCVKWPFCFCYLLLYSADRSANCISVAAWSDLCVAQASVSPYILCRL